MNFKVWEGCVRRMYWRWEKYLFIFKESKVKKKEVEFYGSLLLNVLN